MLLAAGAVDTIARFVDTVILVYLLLILIKILFSWIRRMPYHPWLNAFRGFLGDVVDPYLRIFRRVLPVARLGGVGLDLSPIIGIIVLVILRQVVAAIFGSID